MGEMRRFVRLAAAVLTIAVLAAGGLQVAAAPAGAAGPVTSLTLESEAGDYVGQGGTYSYLPADGTFSGSAWSPGGAVSIRFQTAQPANGWSLDFAPPEGRTMVPGPYEGATRYPFQGPNDPGLDVSGMGRGCNISTGRFDVLEVAYGTGNTLLAFAADFVQYCENGGPAFRGSIRYNASATFPAVPDFDDDGIADTVDRCPSYADPAQLDADVDGIGDACDPSTQNTSLTFLSDHPGAFVGEGVSRTWYPRDGRFGVGSTGPGHVAIAYNGGASRWHLDFRAPTGGVLGVGTYTGALRGETVGNPGLDVSGSGRSCNEGSGEFEVLRLVRAPDGTVQQFAADFVFDCEDLGKLLYGGIRYNAGSLPGPSLARRIAGEDRVATALAAADTIFKRATVRDEVMPRTVVLARADSFADALAGTPLAAALNAPLLLTPGDSLDPRVLAGIKRLAPAGATIQLLGGTSALSPFVESSLESEGFKVRRLAGADRYATAVAIAQAIGTPRVLLLATGQTFPDGLTAGAAAARVDGAVLLTTGSAMPPATAQYLAAHSTTPVIAIGGPAAAARPSALAIVGTDRYDTSSRVAAAFFPVDAPIAGLASGETFPDALAGGANIAIFRAPLLLTRKLTLPAVVSDYLDSHTSLAVQLYGGTAAIDDAVLDELLGPTPNGIGKTIASWSGPTGQHWRSTG
jgi:putative cell wall-binding protein